MLSPKPGQIKSNNVFENKRRGKTTFSFRRNYALKTLRPFFLLLRKTDLPPTVFILDRKPCLFLRLRLLG